MSIAAAQNAHAQQASKPKIDLVTVVGCATRSPDKTWTLTKASEAKVVKSPATTPKEIDDARHASLGGNRFRLIGTLDFGPPEDILSDPLRSQFTAKGSENTSAQLVDGHKVVVRGLLIKASNETRINLTSVQELSDNCK
jgi:hypothetical protein